MDRIKIKNKIKELGLLKGWLEQKLQLVEFNLTPSGEYSTVGFVNKTQETDEQISEKIEAYNMLCNNLPLNIKKINSNDIYRARMWYSVFMERYYKIVGEFRNDIQKNDSKKSKVKKQSSHKDKLVNNQTKIGKTISSLFKKIGKKISNIVQKFPRTKVRKETYFTKLTNAWKHFVMTRKNKKNIENNQSNPIVVNPMVTSFISLTDKLMKKFDLNSYNNCLFAYKKLVSDGHYEKLSLKIRENFEKIKEMVEAVDSFNEKVNSLSLNNINEQLYIECKNNYNQLLQKYDDYVADIINNSIIMTLKEIEVSLNNKNEENNRIITNIEILLKEMYGFRVETSEDSFDKCENLIQSSLNLINDLIEKNNSDKVILKKTKELIGVREELSKELRVAKFTKFVNDNFSFNSDEIKYDSSELVHCIQLYNSLSEDEKKYISKNTLRLYEDVLRFDSVLTLKTMIEVLDIDKCINNNNYSDIYYCCKIYDRFNSKLRGGKSKGGNDMAKRRCQGRREINSFDSEINDKLKLMLEIRENKINDEAVFNVSYFDSLVNRKNRHFAFVEIMVNDEEVERITIPLTGELSNEDEVCYNLIEKYPNIDLSNVNFNNQNKVYKKVL